MRTFAIAALMFTAAAGIRAQQWEVGALAGGGFVPGVSVTSGLGSATTGFQSGAAFGVFVGQNLYSHLSGEIHYGFMQSNLKLESGSTKVTFAGRSHVVHYDIVYHTNRKGAKAQAFVAVGGGMKIYQGTGKQAAYQPLNQYAYLTHTRQTKAMLSVGAGVKVALAPHMYLRTEVRDYVTMFPKDVIFPAPGAKVGRLLHDLVPMAGISFDY